MLSTSVNSTHMRDWTEASFTNTRAAGSSRPTSPTSPTSSSISWDSTCIRSQTHLHSHQTYHTLPKHSTPPASPRAMTSSPTFTSTEPSSPTGQHSSKFSQLQARFESNTSLASTSSSVSFATHTQNQTKATASMTNHTSESLASLVSNSTAVTTSATIDAVCPPLQSTTTPSRRNSYRKPNGAQHPLAIVSTFDSDHEGSTSSLPNAATHNDSDDRTLWSSSPEPIERRSSLTKASPGTMAIDAAVHLEAKLALQEHMSRAGPSEPSSSDTQRMSQDDMSMLKDAVKSVAPRVFSLSIKSRESVSGAHHADQNLTSELEWTSLAVTSGGEQPLSPVTASHPTNTGHTLGFAFQDAQQQQQQQQQPQNGQGEESRDSSQPEDPPQTIENTNGPAEEPSRPTRSSPQPSKHFEIWTPPPPGQRPACFPERPSTPLRHPQGRLQRILKHRSFNFQFSNVPATSHEGSSTARASMDSNVPPRTGSASDNPRQQLYQVGPPDPIPPHYQHLQSRTSPAFRRRSHAGELDRFSPGWIVAEHNAAVAASNQSTPRVSVNEDRSSADMNARRHSHSVAGSRRVSLGVQTPAPSMWSRLLSSIFIGGPENNSSGTDSESDLFNMENRGPVAADPIVQQRLLLTPLSLQQNVHPLYQQQLFFYADEVEEGTSPQDLISRASQDVDTSSVDPRARSASEDSTYTATTTSCTISANGDNSSNVSLHPHFRSLANNANLQGELAQEDGRESLEMMNHDTSEPFLRPETPGGSTFGTSTGGDSDLTRPRSPLTVHNKIPVSSLALSSPPSYWEAAIKYKGWAKIEPRPEQGQEALPRYSCSVFREGCVNRKTELIGNWRPYRRPWKRSFAHLRGTALRLYAVDMDDVPRLHVRNISLQMARCEIATDYKQRPNVIRIRACDRTILMECKDRIDALTWLEHLQAAANIASSLEDRCMPKFYTLPRAAPQQSQQQQRRHTSATTTMSSHQHSGLGSPTSSGVSQHHQREQSAGHQQQQQPPRPLSPNSEEMAALDHQQLQRQLQEQQEHNLQRQIQEEMHNRALQRLVLSSEDSRVVSPSLSQSQAMSPTETSQNTSTSRRQSRNSLLTLAERERVLTESELNSETTTRQEDLIMRNVLHALGLSSDESGSSVVDTDEEEDRQRRERIRQTRRMSMPVTAMAARSQAQSGQQQQQQQEWSQGLRIQLADNNVSNGSGNGPRRSSRQWTRVLGGLLSGGGHGHGGSQQGSSTSENNSNGGSLPAISTVSPMAS
ncbi:hypothetical protein BGZ83_008697 [Gryganskiella cystojenkinii]|nr:hypothetical protein BGZ83_008697 [Gryganskiella cystojenkinii]